MSNNSTKSGGEKKKKKKTPIIVKGMGRQGKGGGDKLELRVLGNKPCKSCIVFIGSRRSGKSSTIEKLTSSTVKVFEESQQFETYPYSVVDDDNLVQCVETKFDWEENNFDSEKCSDDLVHFLGRHGVSRIKCVVWNVIPNYVARDSALGRQGEVIDGLCRREIWRNVVVVCKQSSKPERDGLGAIRTAEKFYGLSLEKQQQPQVMGYRFYSEFAEDSFNSNSRVKDDDETRRTMNVKTDEEIVQILEQAFRSCGEGVAISRLEKDLHTLLGEEEDEEEAEEMSSISVYDPAYKRGKIKTVFGLPPMVLPTPF